MAALESRCRELIQIGDSLFSKKGPLNSLRQEIAESYYWQRADFTTPSWIGDDGAAGSMTSYPYLARQETGNQLSVILRSGEWFGIHVKKKKIDEDQGNRKWLEWATDVQRRAMYDPEAGMVRAAREADQDIVTFGEMIIGIEPDMKNVSLRHRCKHPRDCAWTEDYGGKVDTLHENWNPTARQLKQRRMKLHHSVEEAAKKEPEREIKCRRFVVPREDYGYADGKTPKARWQSVYVDMENEWELESSPIGWFPYVVSRFSTISGSQYGYSPCVVMPDARSAQTIRRVLLEAGEKGVDPPMILSRDVFREDVPIYAGGFTFADLEEGQSLSDVFQMLSSDKSGLSFGLELEKEIKETIANSFFLNKMTLPPDVGKMTAYEARKRIEEHIRGSAPLWEPLEQDYSAQLCARVFEILRWTSTTMGDNGAFGAPDKWPEALQGSEIEFEFQNPMKEMANEMKGQRFMEGLQILGTAATFDQSLPSEIDMRKSFRDAMRGNGWAADWFTDEEEALKAREQAAEAAKMQQGLQALQAGAGVAEQGGRAAQALQQAGVQM